MSNYCIYTGATLLVRPYNFIVAADLYRCNGQIIARINPPHTYDYNNLERATHEVFLDRFQMDDFYHPDAGIVVAFHGCYVALPNARPDAESLHP